MVDDGVPLLGICVGLQWLFEGSDEAPGVRGLWGLHRNLCGLTPFCGNRDSKGVRPLH